MGRAVGSRNGFRICRVCRAVKPRAEFKEPFERSICLECPRDYAAEYARKKAAPDYREKQAAGKRKSMYGVSPEGYAAMQEAQDSKCAICRSDTSLVIDHDHGTGEVRALLCLKCNAGIGFLRDNADLVRAAADYLNNWKRRYPRGGFMQIETA